MKSITIISALFLFALSPTAQALAEDKTAACNGTDTPCLMKVLEDTTDTISEERWRDQTYRELAKLLAREKQIDHAIVVLNKIKNPDTVALTIRGIGMNAVDAALTPAEYNDTFTKLRAEAEKIQHPPSYAIALTYIAMAQAFAADDAGAMKTALSMENAELRNKALGESAEIQAERGDLTAATQSIAAIDDPAFRNKAFGLISKIFANQEKYGESYEAAQKINNNYQSAQAVLYLLAKQITPEETKLK